mgnify:CR=1 FL=1
MTKLKVINQEELKDWAKEIFQKNSFNMVDVSSKKEEAVAFFKLDPNKKTILVLGGSLGARRINQLIEKELKFLLAQQVLN